MKKNEINQIGKDITAEPINIGTKTSALPLNMLSMSNWAPI